MTPLPKSAAALLVAFAMIWHAMMVVGSGLPRAAGANAGLDFPSFYYAAQNVARGGSPYDTPTLEALARSDTRRKFVYPYIYTPPFVAATLWLSAMEYRTAFMLWFWLDELAALLCGLVLWRWWRPHVAHLGPLLALLCALPVFVINNHTVGQANLISLLILLCGLWRTDQGFPRSGGVLVGIACMLKMSPALFVAWWILRREWTAVGFAVGTALVISAFSLPWVGIDIQREFYTSILPSILSGDYNGLPVSLALFSNHSVANIFHQLYPGSGSLSGPAQALTRLTIVLMLVGAAWAMRRPPRSGWQTAGQVATVLVMMLLTPVYTYEHHLVFALPAAALCASAALQGRLRGGWAIAAGLSIAVLLFDVQLFRHLAGILGSPFGLLLQEAKFAALLGLLGCSLAVARDDR